MFKKFLPKQHHFFEHMHNMALHIKTSADYLMEMFSNKDKIAENASQIHILENKCDDMIHKLVNELNETFITPIDREDIHALANALDNVMDRIDSIATRMALYKIKSYFSFSPQLSQILLSQAELLVVITKSLGKKEKLFDQLISIRNLETEGDNTFRLAIGDLFDNEKDILELIKKKEILEMLERAVDECQTSTIVMESILIKNI